MNDTDVRTNREPVVRHANSSRHLSRVVWLLSILSVPAIADELVGTSPGEFSVSNSGAATYVMPIDTPSATGGMRPNVSLAYNHRGGNGIAGQGWTVGGLSKITRCSRTLDQDGDGRGVRFDLSDRFCLDGQRLVLVSGTYGVAGSKYRTENESFKEIVAGLSQGNGPQYFIVTDRDGTQSFYGHVNNSSLTGLANTYSNWARYAVKDTFGNAAEFFYNVPGSSGELTLNRIEYTANPAQGLSPRYKVSFEYEDRPDSDKRSGFTYGVIWSKDKRLSRIVVQNLSAASQWEVVRDYTLQYAPDATVISGRSQLISVQQCQGSTCLPQTTFDWQNADIGWESVVSSGQSSSGHTNTMVGDFNNDGQHDLYVVKDGDWHILRASGGTFSAALDTNKVATGSHHRIDLNGDGKIDILYQGTDSKWHVYQSTGTGFTNIATTLSTTGIGSRSVQDANGDGRDDLIYISNQNEVYLRKSTGTDFESTATLMMNTIATNITLHSRSYLDPERQLDFNGDGRGDIVLKEVTASGGGGGGGSPTTEWVAYTYNDFGYTFFDVLDDDVSRHFVDINGDGLDDVAYYSAGSWRHAISTGSSFATPLSSSISDSNPTKAIFADYNGDGRDDLICATSTDWIVHKSNGDGFDSTGVSIGGPEPLVSQAVAMDVSGRGYDELVMAHSTFWKIRDHLSPAADVVTKITDGLGNTFEPTYSSLAGMADYLGTATGTFPIRRFSKPFYVVDSVSMNDGVGGAYSTDYKYWDAMLHTRGYGFLGFDVLEAHDSRDNTYRRLVFAQEIPYRGMIDDFFVKQSNGTNIRRNNPSLSNTQFGTFPNIRYFVRAETRTAQEFEVGVALNGQEIRKTVYNPTYETTYGNVTSSVITTTSAQAPGDTYTTTLNFQYANYPIPWCLGLPTQVQVTRSAPGATTKTRTINNTFNSANCGLMTSTNASMSDTSLQLKTALTYDSFGNVKTITQDSASGAADDRKAEYIYDQWGHLPESQKQYVDNAADPQSFWTWDYKLTRPLTQSNAQGHETEWQFDSFGRVTSETRPDGTSITTNYTACVGPCEFAHGSFYIEHLGSDGLTIRDYRDSYGRPVGGWRHLPTGTKSKRQIDYDHLGRVDRQYIPWVDGESNYYADLDYDLLGRLIEVDRPINEGASSGAITTAVYQGLSRTVTNAENQVRTYDFDPLGRMLRVTDQLTGETDYEFTAFDQLHKTWDPADALTTINYNDRGDKISMTAPDMGTWIYAYNVFGELVSQTDAKSQTTGLSYNQLGLLNSRTEDEGTTTWNYFTTADYKLWLPSSVSSPGGFAESYGYDSLSRPSSVTTTIDSTSYVTNLAYHSTGSGKGKLKRITYPVSTSGFRFKVDYDYDAWGLLERVKNGTTPTIVYYELSETDAFGRQRLAALGNGLDEDRDYDDANGFLKTLKSGPNLSATVQDLSYAWDMVGNLEQRQDLNQGKTEVFTYDGLNRVKTAALNGVSTLTVNYESNGNISYKSDVGTYAYPSGSNAVTGITGIRPGSFAYDPNGNMTDRDGDPITWYSYNKPARIDYGSDYSEFNYGPDRARFKQIAVTGGNTVTTYYAGAHFENEVQGSVTKYRHHILAGGRAIAIHTRPSSGSITTRYIQRDHLNSVAALTDENGTIVEQYSFDAFGKRRNPDWTADSGDLQFAVSHLTERGYTGHEHLDNVRLTHMNGRVQDPILGRMISADPFISDPVNSQSYDRYSYVLNRPLSLIDPSGFEPTEPRDVYSPSDICAVSGVTCEARDDTVDAAAGREANTDGGVDRDFLCQWGIVACISEFDEDADTFEARIFSGEHFYTVLSQPVCQVSTAGACTLESVVRALNKNGVHPNQEKSLIPGQPHIGEVDIAPGDDHVTSSAVYNDYGDQGVQIGIRNVTSEDHLLRPGTVDRTIVIMGQEFRILTIGTGSGWFGGISIDNVDDVWGEVDQNVIDQFD